jgi:hypothetical protein
MTQRMRTVVAICAVVAVALLSILAGLRLVDTNSLVGLLGVITGALIAEFSRHSSARNEGTHQLRLAALDRRLQAHQEAFALWRRLLADMHDPTKIGETVGRCQDWWDNNCLYLTPEARQAFAQAYLTAHTRHVTVQTRDVELIRHEFEVIRRAGDLIVQGVELPPIPQGEDKPIQK